MQYQVEPVGVQSQLETQCNTFDHSRIENVKFKMCRFVPGEDVVQQRHRGHHRQQSELGAAIRDEGAGGNLHLYW